MELVRQFFRNHISLLREIGSFVYQFRLTVEDKTSFTLFAVNMLQTQVQLPFKERFKILCTKFQIVAISRPCI